MTKAVNVILKDRNEKLWNACRYSDETMMTDAEFFRRMMREYADNHDITIPDEDESEESPNVDSTADSGSIDN